MTSRKLWRRMAVVAALVAGACGQGLADDATRPAVPGFWNPEAPTDKPDPGGIRAIRFVTTNDYPPFGFALASGAAAGFDVDLARAICDELQVECTIQTRPWDDIVPAVVKGQADAAIASLGMTDQARRSVRFTHAYYKTPARFVVRSDSGLKEIGPDQLAGVRVGVTAGSAQQAYLALFFPKALAVPFPAIEAARAALKIGGVDAVFGDGVTLAVWLNGADAGSCCRFAGGPYTEPRFFGAGAGIAVRPSDTALRQALDYALARVAAKGVYGDIYLKYFPVGFY